MTKLSLFLILLLAVTVTTVPAFADDDEFDDDDDERIGLGTGAADMVFYITIAAIACTIGYTGFRIISAKRPKLVKK